MLFRAGAFKDKELLFYDRIDPVVASVNRDKKVILLDDLSQSVHHPDLLIVNEVAYGFDVMGWMPKIRFEAKVNLMAMQPETLDRISGDISKTVFDRIMTSIESNLEGEFYEVTKNKVKKEWFAEKIPIRKFLLDPILHARFAIKQGQKLRSLDDYSFSGVYAFIGKVWMLSCRWFWHLQNGVKPYWKVECMTWVLRTVSWLLPHLRKSTRSLHFSIQRNIFAVYIVFFHCHSGLRCMSFWELPCFSTGKPLSYCTSHSPPTLMISLSFLRKQ